MTLVTQRLQVVGQNRPINQGKPEPGDRARRHWTGENMC